MLSREGNGEVNRSQGRRVRCLCFVRNHHFQSKINRKSAFFNRKSIENRYLLCAAGCDIAHGSGQRHLSAAAPSWPARYSIFSVKSIIFGVKPIGFSLESSIFSIKSIISSVESIISSLKSVSFCAKFITFSMKSPDCACYRGLGHLFIMKSFIVLTKTRSH